MKIVFLMRHAKSDWGNPAVGDFDRPLNGRGLDDAPRMGKALADAGVVPDRVVASPARRARQTAELLTRACGFDGEIAWEPVLYGAPGTVWLETLVKIPEKAESALVVAHSPGIAEAAALLLGGRGGRPRLRFPTGAIACIESAADRWVDVGPGAGELRWLLIPRLVKSIA